MFGIVGKLKIVYSTLTGSYEESIDILNTKKFSLVGAPNVFFSVEEVQYIEDTIYYVVLSSYESNPHSEEIVVDGNGVDFELPDYQVAGHMSLAFID